MGRNISTDFATWDKLTPAKLQALNQELDNIYANGDDIGRVVNAISWLPLKVDIGACPYSIHGNYGIYAGVTDLAVANNSTKYIHLNSSWVITQDATIDINKALLAIVVTSWWAITSITNYKPIVFGWYTGSGDVNWPSSAVDWNIAVFDSTTWKLIKDVWITPATLNNVWYLAWESLTKWDSLYLAADNKLYKTDASDPTKIPSTLKISLANYNISDVVRYDFAWITKALTWLTWDANYYISDTPWAISTTPWTINIFVWTALSSSELFLNINHDAIIPWTSYMTSQLNTQRLTTSTSYIKVKSTTLIRKWTYTVEFIFASMWAPWWDARIYKNWVAYWTNRNSFWTFSENLLFNNWDTCELRIRSSDPSNNVAANSFEVKYKLANSVYGIMNYTWINTIN